MAYSVKDATTTFFNYMGIEQDSVKYIEGTNSRGFVYQTPNGENAVIFLYPISHKADDTKNFFDTRDSGARERGIAWNYAIKNNIKYFCLAIHDQVEKYKDYIFSLECDESRVAEVAGTVNGTRNGPGTQVVIPNNYVGHQDFDRILTRNNFYIAVIHKSVINDYLEKYDNRPYMAIGELIDIDATYDIEKFSDEADNDESDNTPIRFYTGYKSYFNRNRIVFGAPGTGKSFTINNERKELLGDDNDKDYERVTFHPDYSYANFVGTYKPVPSKDSQGNDTITYAYVPGPFMRVYVKALKNSRTENIKPYLLIIEEINRANVAAVFGDIFQLLDRGDDEVSEYPIQASEDIKAYLAKELGGNPEDYAKIRIPDNMFIWATMNSADQGVFPMDTAFKRRWDFTYLGIDDSDEKIRGKYVYLADDRSQKVEWNKLRKAINHFLAKEKINEDKQLGPYFISKDIVVPVDGDEIDSDNFIRVFKNKVIMYLFEDAARQKRSKLFEGCFENSARYSKICREFEEKGIGIFNHDIQLETEPEESQWNRTEEEN